MILGPRIVSALGSPRYPPGDGYRILFHLSSTYAGNPVGGDPRGPQQVGQVHCPWAWPLSSHLSVSSRESSFDRWESP
jgi:hypothetical protein